MWFGQILGVSLLVKGMYEKCQTVSKMAIPFFIPPYGRKWRGTKKPPGESERGEWKSWLKAQHSKNEIMTSDPITSWQINGETVERVSDFIFGVSKITADGDCSHESKSLLPLGRKVMTKLHSILKSRDITLPTKVYLVKAMVFPVVMYGCESGI